MTAHLYGGFALTTAILLKIWWSAIDILTRLRPYSASGTDAESHSRICQTVSVTVIASVALIMLWGPVGAPLSSIIGACPLGEPFPATCLRSPGEEAEVTVAHLVSAMLRSWIWRFVLLAGLCWWLGKQWSPQKPAGSRRCDNLHHCSYPVGHVAQRTPLPASAIASARCCTSSAESAPHFK